MKCYLWLTSLSSNSYFSSHQSTSTFQKVKVTWPKSKKYLKVKVKWYSWFASLFPIKAKNELWNDLSTSMIRQWKWYYQKVKWYSWFGMFHLTHQPLIFRKWSLAFSKSFIGLTTRQGKLLLNKINQVKFTLSKLFDCRKWFKNLTKSHRFTETLHLRVLRTFEYCLCKKSVRLTRGAGKFPDWGKVDQMVRNKSVARPPHISLKTSPRTIQAPNQEKIFQKKGSNQKKWSEINKPLVLLPHISLKTSTSSASLRTTQAPNQENFVAHTCF